MREGEPCTHKGCLNHVSHCCEGCGKIAGRHTLESAIKSYKFGFSVIYDGDNHKIKYGIKCNHCNKYFESYNLDIICLDCCVFYVENFRK